ncbi:MAG TPA: deoxyribodipyrimidine photo-lyase [Candidatus Limnocylindrales bacterium]|nr:deoxyribodipyrimidine photo-lyase [Candidatus Limnocylindrales bacterium]
MTLAAGPDEAPVVVWFRRDLRVDDHPALAAAVASGRPVIPLAVLDPALLAAATTGPRRRTAYLAALAALDGDLADRGGRLVVRSGDPADVLPGLAAETGAGAVLATRDPAPAGVRRDAAVSATGIRLHLLPGTLAVEPEAIGPSRVFGAFHRRWLAAPRRSPIAAPATVRVPDGVAGEVLAEIAPVGRADAERRLAAFLRERLARYDVDRHRLDLDGTSGLSTALHFGTISVARVVAAVDAAVTSGAPAAAAAAFLRQLAWRDWAMHRSWFGLDVAGAGTGLPWDAPDPGGELQWRQDAGGLEAWRSGDTGYPTVDAAMRELAATGRIHNRARMIAASFLVKDLLLDWRVGARHFLRELVDGDVANNTLGWRWTAGLGPDAAPFIRVFNPVVQGRRFDPEGDWVRCWIPELRDLPSRVVHEPWAAPGGPPAGYPAPIVDHAAARQRAMAAFASRVRQAAGGSRRARSDGEGRA